MSIENSLGLNFKPEERHRGADLVYKEAVVLASTSDTTVRAFIKTIKVSLQAEGVETTQFQASCSCPLARKGTACKHIWAVLLKLEEKNCDFLNSKQILEINSSGSNNSGAGGPAPEKAAAAKQRQADYRKQQYDKQKARAKDYRRARRGLPSEGAGVDHEPPLVAEARAYFVKNGFFENEPLSLEPLLNAKRLLSRVFHPDKGGSHEETVELNRHFEHLRDYLKA